jgi:hypothetical protein
MRAPERAADAITAYKFAGKDRESELRLALLHVLAMVSATNIDQEDFAKVAKRYNELFRSRKEFSEDIGFLGMIGKILTEDKWMSAENVASMKSRKFKAPDLCARIFSEVAARYLLQNANLHNADEIVKLLDGVSQGIATEDAWARACALSLSLCKSLPDLKEVLESRLADTRTCSISLYPRLKMMEAGLALALDGGLKRDAVHADLARAIEASTVASEGDKAAAKVLLSDNPAAEIASLVSSGSLETAYWAAVMATLASGGTKDEKDRIMEQALKIRPQITRHEKLLMAKIMQLEMPRENRK